MSFIIAAGTIGLTGLGATIGAGAMMGATIGGVGNLIRGKGLFDNLGQNLLVGGAGAGLMSGIGSAMGGKTVEALTAEAAAATDMGNTLKTGAENISLAPGQSPFTLPPATAPASLENFSPANQNFLDSMRSATPTNTDINKLMQPSTIKPATFMQNPADYIAQNPSTAAGVVTGLAGMLQTPDPVKQAPGPGGDKYDYAYKPAQYGPDGRVISQASYGTPTVTHYAAAGGSIPGFAEGGIYGSKNTAFTKPLLTLRLRKAMKLYLR